MLQDVRFALRLMARERWYTAVAVIALALGIGVNAMGFSLTYAALYRGLPFDQSDRLYAISWLNKSNNRSNLSVPELRDWRSQTHTFVGLAGYMSGRANVADERALPESARTSWLTANSFALLRQPPLFGRDFVAGDDQKGAEPVVMLGYRFWMNRYGGDRGVVGKPVRVDGVSATIVGVMPESMQFPDTTDVWMPLIPTARQEQRDNRPLRVFGRLAEGVSIEQARAELTGISQRIAKAYPEASKDLIGARVETFSERFVNGAPRVVFTVLLWFVGFVLLIACANVANLLLSRSAQRAREIAVRMALGATRQRVLRQLLIESLLLGIIGGGLGLLLAFLGVPVFDASITDAGKPFWIVFKIDRVVVMYVAAICILTSIAFGLAPALHVSRANMHDVLKESGRSSVGGKRVRWFSGAMVVVELALTLVLLGGAGLMISTFTRLYAEDLGFNTSGLMALRVILPPPKYEASDARRQFFERLEPQLQTVPGAEGIVVTTSVPPFGAGERPIEIEGRPARGAGDAPWTVGSVTITPRFFDVLRTPLLRGRGFNEKDGTPGAEYVIVNQKFASQYFPGDDPIGKRFRFAQRTETYLTPEQRQQSAWLTIIGISPVIRHNAQNPEPRAVAYLPLRFDPPVYSTLLVRSGLPPASVMDAIRREVQRVDPDQPVLTIETMDQMLSQQRWPFRVFGTLLGVFALIALVLSSVGLYAVMAYSVSQRTQEIGVHMALGAEARQVSWMILRRGLIQLGIGLALGLAGAYGVSKVLHSAIEVITPGDPVTFVTITALMIAVALAACLVPARRATRVDPLVALRPD
jgi:putative ABC transport system permease protein